MASALPALVPMLSALLAGLSALGDRQRAIAIEILSVETRQSTLAKLLASEESLGTEQLRTAH